MKRKSKSIAMSESSEKEEQVRMKELRNPQRLCKRQVKNGQESVSTRKE